MKIITVGGRFLDIDGLGAGVAYAELLSRQGSPAKFVCTGTLNESITNTIRGWNLPIETTYRRSDDDWFVVVDNSAPDWLEFFVTEHRIAEIIDHHLGNESYWQERGVQTDIEFIGACCTLIYERWLKSGRLEDMSKLSARLLACGILDNTLNFKASVTTERDKSAFATVLKKSGLGDDWPKQYFEECQQGIEKQLDSTLQNDTKQSIQYPGYASAVTISQLAVWDGRELLKKRDELVHMTEKYGSERSIHIISISEGKNYFLTVSPTLRDFYVRTLGLSYDGQLAVSDRLWLRKEIMKRAIEKENNGE